MKITIMFRGRETTHPERGEQLLMRLAEDVADLGAIEQRPNLDGRNMTMVLGPVKQKEAGEDEGGTKRESGSGKDSRRNRAAAEAAPAEEPAAAPAAAAEAEAEADAEPEPEPAAEEEIRRSA